MTKRHLIDASIADIRAAVYAEGPLRHEYQKEPATFVLELCARVEELKADPIFPAAKKGAESE